MAVAPLVVRVLALGVLVVGWVATPVLGVLVAFLVAPCPVLGVATDRRVGLALLVAAPWRDVVVRTVEAELRGWAPLLEVAYRLGFSLKLVVRYPE